MRRFEHGAASFSLSPALRALHAQLGISAEILTERNFVPVGEAVESSLVLVASFPREIKLTRPAAKAWLLLREAAKLDGVALIPISGFRSIEYQAALFRRKLEAGKAVEEILSVNAPPGFSEHHSGCALDLATPNSPPLEEAFAETPAFGWLTQNARKSGFSLSYPRKNPQGFVFEPWHWRWSAET